MNHDSDHTKKVNHDRRTWTKENAEKTASFNHSANFFFAFFCGFVVKDEQTRQITFANFARKWRDMDI